MTLLENSVLVFRTPAKLPGLYDSLFGGLFRIDWLVRYEKLAALACFLVAVTFLYIQYRNAKSFWGSYSRVAALIGFSILVMLLNEPVDEVFINLRHSLHFSETGLFSFNRNVPIEGIVDFLPYFILGCLAKLGLPLPEMTFIQGWLGGLLCIFALKRMAKSFALSSLEQNILFLVFCFSPTLIFNSSIGFSAPLFTAAILWTIAFLFFEPKNPTLGLIGLALIPLIRLEGALASALLFASYFVSERNFTTTNRKKVLLRGIAIALPLFLLSAYRYHTFGSPVPTPVLYKSALGNWFFLELGMKNLVLDLFGGYGLLALFAFAVATFLHFKAHSIDKVRSLGLPLLSMGIFILPYYISGGDWFPPAWGRYLLPFTMLSTFAAIVSFFLLVRDPSPRRKYAYAILGLLVLPYLYFPSAFSLLRQDLGEWWTGRGNFRIQQLSMLGRHLENTTRVTDTIASSEVATVMYFADREALDLLGVANPEIAAQPITGLNLFRRHFPGLVNEKRPEFLYPGDFISTELSVDSSRSEVTQDIKRLRLTFASMNHIFFGGPENLLSMGYRPIVVIFGNRFSALYYVSPEAWPSHLEKLLRAGFRPDALDAALLSRR